MHERALLPLADLDVLVIDCQATAAAPAGHLLELAWMRTRATPQAQHEQGSAASGWSARIRPQQEGLALRTLTPKNLMTMRH